MQDFQTFRTRREQQRSFQVNWQFRFVLGSVRPTYISVSSMWEMDGDGQREVSQKGKPQQLEGHYLARKSQESKH